MNSDWPKERCNKKQCRDTVGPSHQLVGEQFGEHDPPKFLVNMTPPPHLPLKPWNIRQPPRQCKLDVAQQPGTGTVEWERQCKMSWVRHQFRLAKTACN